MNIKDLWTWPLLLGETASEPDPELAARTLSHPASPPFCAVRLCLRDSRQLAPERAGPDLAPLRVGRYS